jgi:hypothetical protein
MGNRRHSREEMLGISAPDHCNIRDVLSSGQRFSHKLQFGPRAADLKGTCNEKVCNIHRAPASSAGSLRKFADCMIISLTSG